MKKIFKNINFYKIKYSKITLKEASNKNSSIIDVRNPNEYQFCHIKNSSNIPLSTLESNINLLDKEKEYVLLCQSGVRSQKALLIFENAGFKKVNNIEGGMNACINEAPPECIIRKNDNNVWEMERQVRFAAGLMVASGVFLSFVNPIFLFLSGGVGVGLMYSGVSNTCAMAKVLAQLPWNKPK
jgi:rhodanese-related sulfurtransferase